MNKKSMLLAASLTATLAATLPAFAVGAFAKGTPLEAGLKDDVAWDIVEGMTTEVGQRQNVAAWAATLQLLGDYEGELKPEQKL